MTQPKPHSTLLRASTWRFYPLLRRAIWLLVVFCFWPEATPQAQTVIRVQQRQQMGLIDTAGNWLRFCEFQTLLPFSQGRALASNGVYEGFLSPDGQVVIPLQYTQAGPFAQGRAPAARNALWGYIDTVGQWILQPQFAQAEPFSEGLAAVQDTTTQLWGYIDQTGKYRIPPRYTLAFPFVNGLAGVQDTATQRWGYCSPTGTWVVPPQYDFVAPHQQGFAQVQLADKWGLLSMTGRQILAPQYYGLLVSPAQGRIWAETQLGYEAYTTAGKRAFAQTYSDVGRFSEGFAPVRTDDGQWQYITPHGQLQCKLAATCSHAEPFAQGLAVAICGGKVGYINTQCEWVIAPQYEQATAFVAGIAAVRLGGKWALINTQGHLRTGFLFDEAPLVEPNPSR